MTIMWLPDGGPILFLDDGGPIAFDEECCCEPGVCCPEAIGKTLYLSITGNTFDGAGCGAGCTPSLTSEASFGTWGPGAVWLIAPGGAGTAILMQLSCTTGNTALHWDDDTGLVRDATPATICSFTAGATGYDLEGHTCDPFYWEGDIPVQYFDSMGAPCDTGTIHVIVTE